MKKKLAFFLALVLFAAVLSVAVSSAQTVPALYMKPTVNAEKNTLTLEVFTNGLRWTAFDGGIRFDPEALTLTSVTEGSKIGKARGKGFDFITDYREIATSNQLGYCNFVAVTGSSTCKMTNYSGPVVVFSFAVKDLAKAKVGYDLCLNTLTDASGQPLLEYTPFAPDDPPKVHLANGENPFLYGDVDMDDRVSVYDALLVLDASVGAVTLEEYQKYLALVNGENEISIYDALAILDYAVGKIEAFPVEG